MLSKPYCTSIPSRFVANDSCFVLGLQVVIVDCHFVAMSLFCLRSLLDFCWLFVFVFSSGCVYFCFHLPCTFDGWVPILEFYLQGSPLAPTYRPLTRGVFNEDRNGETHEGPITWCVLNNDPNGETLEGPLPRGVFNEDWNGEAHEGLVTWCVFNKDPNGETLEGPFTQGVFNKDTNGEAFEGPHLRCF